jgi:23S rRNA (adenine-N6)-dimethyltransferase
VAGPPRPRWGWHRLDDRWARRLVADARVAPGDLVLDIGAGTGALTAALRDAGAHVVAIERHPGRAAALRRRFDGSHVTVVQADASDLRLPRRPFRVVANPPFGICKPVLKRLLSSGSRMVAADLVVPRHVAVEWTSPQAPGAGRWHPMFVAARGHPVPASAFIPPAPKGAVLLVVRRR